MTTRTLIEAGPGSGKTTTLIHSHNYVLSGQLPGYQPTPEQYIIMETIRQRIPKIHAAQAVFACMTDAGKQDLISKIPSDTKCFTYNGLGASLLQRRHRFQKLDHKRGEKLLEAVLGERLEDMEWKRRRVYYTALRYVKHLKEELLTPSEASFDFVQAKYGIEAPPPEDTGAMRQLMERMMIVDGSVEWIDQYWLAVQSIQSPTYTVGYVDECQDLSPLKLLLMLKSCEHLIFCGDPYQAINGFAGADYRAFDRLSSMCPPALPLKTCFRCPPNHVEHANTIRPARIVAKKTEAIPDISLQINDLGAYITENVGNPKENLLIARLNNILLRVGIKLMKQGVACHLLQRTNDRSLEVVLTDYIKQTRATTLSQLLSIATADSDNASKLGFQAGSFVKERSDCIIELSEGCKTIPQLLNNLYSLTKDAPGSVALSTIHKSKGLEAERVYILYPPVQLQPDNQEQVEQEINLEFVSETRSKHQKIYVSAG